MAPDFTQYTPPGVYVEQQDVEGLFGTQGVPTATVTVVAYSRGYQQHTQTVALVDSGTVLAKKGILPDGTDNIPNLTVTTLHGDVLVKDTDYTLETSISSTADQASTTLKRKGTATSLGEIVTVSYAYTDAFYYSPKSFDDYTVVEDIYGPAMVSALPGDGGTQVNSPLSLAARIAFSNGAGTVVCLAVEPPVSGVNYQARFTQAYTKLANSYTHTMIVPIFDQKSLGVVTSAYPAALQDLISDVRAHCVDQAINGYGRIALVGGDTVMDEEGAITFEDIASTIKSNRVMLAYPPRLNYFNASLRQGTEVGGVYLAAAYGGVLASNSVNRGLTQQTVYGFLGIPEALRAEMDMAAKNSLSSSGVAVAEPGRTSNLVCRHGVTTDMTTLATREVSLTRVNDLIYQLMSEAMTAAELIGDPIDDFMTTRVKSVVVATLETVVTNNLILEYVDVLVRQQVLTGGDPTVIECLFTYRPMLPLNYITIGFTMDLSTGAVTPAEEQVLV